MKEFRQAAADGDLQKIKNLYETGLVKNINEGGKDSERTALHWAAYKGHIEIVKYLIGLRANIDVLDKDKNSPFNLVIQATSVTLTTKLDIMDIFIKNKADPLVSNNKGKTPLMNIKTFVRGQGTSNQQLFLKALIHRIKEIIVEKAKLLNSSVAIRPDGTVVFGDASDLILNSENLTKPSSGMLNISIIEPGSNNSVPFHF